MHTSGVVVRLLFPSPPPPPATNVDRSRRGRGNVLQVRLTARPLSFSFPLLPIFPYLATLPPPPPPPSISPPSPSALPKVGLGRERESQIWRGRKRRRTRASALPLWEHFCRSIGEEKQAEANCSTYFGFHTIFHKVCTTI